MAARRLLVVATVPLDGDVLRERVKAATGETDAELRVLAPAARMSRLQWLASEEDEARAEAEETAARTGGEPTDPDPVVAIEDALREFEADEIVVVTRSGERASFLEEDAGEEARRRFGIPVRELDV